ncbi:transferase activity protein [[Candida] boidinii]|uniref:Unnamed protein product n=1 Tax=Candida boidinii TaxID=5477 RepID=A0ACB5TNU4_CANBO|nr:transferase activity protein [[Candida] boidinii]OWB75563.1 transferase activity protein [[Candida] boidinii]OWB81019.1 transferase activity protein [[Candida] boidinii]GME69823.1 unnamed protein product [[Candida] boidinii]GME92293.1 unnamed protein product [[Candida] boidinii]
MGKPNREILSGGKKYHQKKSRSHQVDEVVFNKDDRVEYLTGFHKRKLQRKKKAQEYLAEQDRLNRLEERRQIREERQTQIQKRLEEINKTKNDIRVSDSSDDDEEDDDFNDTKKKNIKNSDDEGDSDESTEWTGFNDDEEEEEADEENDQGKHGILKQIYRIDDEDASVTGKSVVTIESLDKDDFDSNGVNNKIAELNHVDLSKSKEILDKSIERAKKYARLVGVDNKPKKIKKKKFRYLSKTERKIKNLKEKKKNFKN